MQTIAEKLTFRITLNLLITSYLTVQDKTFKLITFKNNQVKSLNRLYRTFVDGVNQLDSSIFHPLTHSILVITGKLTNEIKTLFYQNTQNWSCSANFTI